MLWFVLRRIGGGLLTLLVVSIVVFAATEVLPGDAAGAILGRNASEENLAEVRGLMGLDDPAAQRYAEWLRRPRHGRPRQLGGGLRAGHGAADLGRGLGQAASTRSSSPASRRC